MLKSELMKERHKLIASSYLVIVNKDNILLSRRFNTGYEDGNYGLVAGHVEKDESFTQAVIRECKEEIGIKIDTNDLKVVHVMHRRITDERVDVFFLCEKWKGEIKNLELNKCDDLKWFDINKLPKNIVPYVREAINHIINNKHYSEFGY